MGCPPLAPPAIFWLIHMEGLGWESELSALAESTPLPQKPSAPPHTHTHLQGLPHPLSWARPPRDLAAGHGWWEEVCIPLSDPRGPALGSPSHHFARGTLGETWAGAGLHSLGGGGSGGG